MELFFAFNVLVAVSCVGGVLEIVTRDKRKPRWRKALEALSHGSQVAS